MKYRKLLVITHRKLHVVDPVVHFHENGGTKLLHN